MYREFEIIPPTDPTKPLILYFDEYSRLQVGTWGADVTKYNMIFTQFGGVIGFTYIGDVWSSQDIKFNPTGKRFESTGTSYNLIPAWYNWKGDKPSSYGVSENVDFISIAPYHTIDNVQAGWGDICKLVGYTSDQISKLTALPTPVYRLPTNPENSAFVGYDHDGDGTPSGVAGTNDNVAFNVELSGSNPGIGTFKSGYSLPLSGYRSTNGSPSSWGHGGFYWSSTPAAEIDASKKSGYALSFWEWTGKYLHPSDTSNANSEARAIRCVRAD